MNVLPRKCLRRFLNEKCSRYREWHRPRNFVRPRCGGCVSISTFGIGRSRLGLRRSAIPPLPQDLQVGVFEDEGFAAVAGEVDDDAGALACIHQLSDLAHAEHRKRKVDLNDFSIVHLPSATLGPDVALSARCSAHAAATCGIAAWSTDIRI